MLSILVWVAHLLYLVYQLPSPLSLIVNLLQVSHRHTPRLCCTPVWIGVYLLHLLQHSLAAEAGPEGLNVTSEATALAGTSSLELRDLTQQARLAVGTVGSIDASLLVTPLP